MKPATAEQRRVNDTTAENVPEAIGCRHAGEAESKNIIVKAAGEITRSRVKRDFQAETT